MKHVLLAIPLVLACSGFSPVQAQIPDDLIEVGILPGGRTDGGQHVAGMVIRLAPGWKTYWRAPGEGGIPPSFDWSGSDNVQQIGVHFPVPEVFWQNDLQSFGYETEVLFPIIIDTERPDAPIELRGSVEIGVCEVVCIPVQFDIAADLPASGSISDALELAMEDRPETGGRMACDITPISDGLRVRVETQLDPMGDRESAVLEASEPGLWISPASVSRDGNRFVAEVEMVPPNGKPFALSRSELRLTVLANGRGSETVGCN